MLIRYEKDPDEKHTYVSFGNFNGGGVYSMTSVIKVYTGLSGHVKRKRVWTQFPCFGGAKPPAK